MRFRERFGEVGSLPTGRLNAITDVSGVAVGHASVVYDEPSVVRSGVTVVLPRPTIRECLARGCAAAVDVLNGDGEMTGRFWIDEIGSTHMPLALTSTLQVGLVRDTLCQLELEQQPEAPFLLPVAAETFDGFLSDPRAFPLKSGHVRQAFENVSTDAVAEGSVGGGTGMICHGFKGGIGTSSRLVCIGSNAATYTVGVLVQANQGRRPHLRIQGVRVGEYLPNDVVPDPYQASEPEGGSIIVIIATDAPLSATQLRRVAKRATVGIGRVGGGTEHCSGDIAIAFSTANDMPLGRDADPLPTAVLPEGPHMDQLFHATADATEEAILNALCAAQTMVGYKGRTVHGLPLDKVSEILRSASQG